MGPSQVSKPVATSICMASEPVAGDWEVPIRAVRSPDDVRDAAARPHGQPDRVTRTLVVVVTAGTREALTYETMVRQGLPARRPVGVADAVRSVLALQAQEPVAPYLALWNRIEGFDANDLDRALADGAIVKASLFRFTLHAIDAGDLPWARAAMRSRVRDAGYHDVLDDIGLTAQRVDEILERLSTVMAEPHDNADMEKVLSELVPEAGDPARLWSALRAVGAFRHAPTSGPWSFGPRPAFVPCAVAANDEPAAIAELVRRYLTAFGPATVADLSQFTILERAALREVVESMADAVAVAGPDGARLLDVNGGGPRPEAELATLPPRLLGMWDSVLLAYADRSRVIPRRAPSTRHPAKRRRPPVRAGRGSRSGCLAGFEGRARGPSAGTAGRCDAGQSRRRGA